MSAAAVIAIRRKRLVRRFREAGATDLEHAVTPEALGERPSWILDQMVRHGAFHPVPGGRFYLDERVAETFLRQRRRRALRIAGGLLLGFVLLWLLGLFGR
jgi:hypothetical protein